MTKHQAIATFKGLGVEPYVSNYVSGWRVFVDGHHHGQQAELEIRHSGRLYYGKTRLPVKPADFETVIQIFLEGRVG